MTGKTFNIETTSGASPARDAWIRHLMPMTDRAIANGLYMKTLSGKEALAVMAGIVLEHEFAEKRYQEAWDVAEVLRPYYPNNLAVLLAPADAAAGLIREEYLSKYPKRSDGLAWRDTSGKVRAFLAETGNPYQRIALDTDGSAGIQWEIQDVPQTFVVDGRGIVRGRIAGEMSKDVLTRQLLPLIAAARKTS